MYIHVHVCVVYVLYHQRRDVVAMEDNLPFDLILIFLKGLIPENKL